MRKIYIIASSIAAISFITLIGWADQNSRGSGQWLVEVDPIGWTKNRPFLDGVAG